jgi:hypothetical protein
VVLEGASKAAFEELTLGCVAKWVPCELLAATHSLRLGLGTANETARAQTVWWAGSTTDVCSVLLCPNHPASSSSSGMEMFWESGGLRSET